MARTATVAGVEVGLEHWIGGERVDSPGRFPDRSPIDQSLLGEVARGGKREAEAAVAAARQAFPAWAGLGAAERGRLLYAVADGIERRLEELSAVETADNGSLLRANRRGLIPRAAHNLRFFADWAVQLHHSPLETRGHHSEVAWDPAGVAVVITPWNAPLMLETWRAAPALAAGNTVVLKPAEWSPLTASLLADITHESGLPPGVLNVVQGLGEEAGAALTTHPGVDRISFTGSGATGRAIAAAAGRTLTPVSLELGGKSPFLVFGDADLEAAVRQAVGQYDNAGQVCLAGTRLLVQEGAREEFQERFLALARTLAQGDPREEATQVGPLIAPRQLERVDGFVRRARAAGARLLLGGGPNERLGGLYYLPTLLVDAPPDAEVLREEVFGPVLTLQGFRDEEEAVSLANGTEYGLAATLWTGDRSRAERVSRQLVAGTVWVNCFFVRDLRAPFGGSRESGIGREGGQWSFDFHCDLKTTVFSPQGWRD